MSLIDRKLQIITINSLRHLAAILLAFDHESEIFNAGIAIKFYS